MPGTERYAVFDGACTGIAPSVLRRDVQPGNAQISALLLWPNLGCVLDRHRLKIGAELYAQVPDAVMGTKIIDDRVAKPVGLAAQVKRRVGKVGELGRYRCECNFHHVVPI